jgi:hypothetical protein
MRMKLFLISAAVVVVILLAVFWYLHRLAAKSPSIVGGGYDAHTSK